MPTRRKDPDDGRFCQGAFASSAEFDRGILANLVAQRCHKLTDREEVAMLHWLQQVSWREGGLEKFTADFLAEHKAQVGTRSMLKFGTDRGRVYNASEVRSVRSEIGENTN